MINIEHSKTILAPTDFTPVGDAALKHANIFAERMLKTVTIFHVIEDFNEKLQTMERLKPIAETNQAETGIHTEFTTSTGTIFEQIGQAADMLNAAFVVMGTHGIKGMQKITGSHALKVISKSHKPFVVVQKVPSNNPYKTIIVPINHLPESKQPLFHIMQIAKLFNATCHIIHDLNTDPHINMQIKNNVAYAESFLSDNGIEHRTVSVDITMGDFNQSVLRYSKHHHADLITLITPQNISLFEFLMQPTEQYIIANEEAIPVMCIHPDYNAVKYGSVFAK
jgi:nucleotide-binding universal stress UspA family protein